MQIQSEQLGDLALIADFLKSCHLVEHLDTHFVMHGSWEGPSFGKIIMGMLMYIISENDHRISHIEDWAKDRLEVLRWLLEEPDLEPKHFNDNHLGLVLEHFKGNAYGLFQQSHNKELLCFYDLNPPDNVLVARIDSTKIQSYGKASKLLQKGHQQANKRVDLVQAKAMLLTIDPLALPISVQVVSGNQVDDNHYIGTIERAWQESLPKQGVLIVGDTKLGNQENFYFIAHSGNYYLCPLANKQFKFDEIDEALDWVEAHQIVPSDLFRSEFCEDIAADADERIARYVELEAEQRSDKATDFSWSHRRILVCSEDLRNTQLRSLEKRTQQAMLDLYQRFTVKQGRKTIREQADAEAFIQKTLKRYKVTELLDVQLIAPPSPTGRVGYTVQCSLNEQAYQRQVRRAGWRAYATNAPTEKFSAKQLIICYRHEYRIEQQFHYLLNKCTALQPIFLQKDNRIEALIRLMFLALQYVGVIQHKARTELKKQDKPYLTKIVPGNPGKKVYKPTTSAILRAFKSIHLVKVKLPNQVATFHTTGLEQRHIEILRLYGIDPGIYLHPSCQRTRKNLTET